MSTYILLGVRLVEGARNFVQTAEKGSLERHGGRPVPRHRQTTATGALDGQPQSAAADRVASISTGGDTRPRGLAQEGSRLRDNGERATHTTTEVT